MTWLALEKGRKNTCCPSIHVTRSLLPEYRDQIYVRSTTCVVPCPDSIAIILPDSFQKVKVSAQKKGPGGLNTSWSLPVSLRTFLSSPLQEKFTKTLCSLSTITVRPISTANSVCPRSRLQLSAAMTFTSLAANFVSPTTMSVIFATSALARVSLLPLPQRSHCCPR